MDYTSTSTCGECIYEKSIVVTSSILAMHAYVFGRFLVGGTPTLASKWG
jgi:hypothetical protein